MWKIHSAEKRVIPEIGNDTFSKTNRKVERAYQSRHDGLTDVSPNVANKSVAHVFLTLIGAPHLTIS